MRQLFQLSKLFFCFWFDVFKSWRLLVDLTIRDFKSNYFGSYLSFVWNFIQPCIIFVVFFVVFQYAFKMGSMNGHPYFIWLMTGMVPWFFFSDSFNAATNSIVAYDYLVKKVVFRVSVLPLVKIASAFFVHAFFIVLIFIALLHYGYYPCLQQLQVLYYLFATVVLLVGLSWLTSSLVIFMKDVGQIVNVLLQIGFWACPIIWNYNVVPQKYRIFVKLNPVFYLIQGYRQAFLYKTWFWQTPMNALYFWSVTGVILFTGAIIFVKLRPHFADVL